MARLTNKSAKLGVIGSPVTHSLSPVIHNYMIGKLAMNYIYLPFDVKPGNAGDFLSAAPLVGVTGFNVTMPHKQDIFAGVAEAIGDAHKAGSVNTAVLRDGKWLGYSTDGDGFNLALAEKGISLKGKKLLILGAGGAARAVILNAQKSGAERILVLNRTVENAAAMARSLGVLYGRMESATVAGEFKKADILINSTPLGMQGFAHDFKNFDFLNADAKIVCDLIYRPFKTELLKRAEQKGHLVLNGLAMLIYQAVLSLELFTEVKIDALNMKANVENYLISEGYIEN